MTDAAPSLDTEAVFKGFTGIQHRPLRKRGGLRSQPYTSGTRGISYSSAGPKVRRRRP